MKTRDRILHTSLLLFNEEGEPSTTTVDIANEMDISPGNLYYHFRGKDIIIAELFNQFEQGLGEILNAPLEQPLNVEDNWFYLYVVFEEMYNYRFLYRNLSDLLRRYPELKTRFRRVLKLKRAAILAVWETLTREAVVSAADNEVEALVDNMVLLLNYWLNYDHLRHDSRAPALVIHQGVYQLMVMIAPYLGEQQREFYEQVREIYRTIIKPAAESA
ncbi:MAG: TetR/AcrR family transcriptional regulator [Gammaproteobacteria bacterium]|nr:TetR/AcrR family transcriptional regulator [Gammaproteobacteria bacterium]